MNSLRLVFAGTLLLVLAAAGVVHAAEAPPLAQTDTPSPSPEPERPAETPAVAEDAAEAPAPAVSEAEPYAAPRFQEKIDLDAIQLEPFYEKLAAKAAPEQTPLTLEECIRRALKSNLDIQIVSFGALKSSADILAAKGEFDPIGTGNLTYTETEQQASSQIFAYGGVSSIEDYRARGQAGIQESSIGAHNTTFPCSWSGKKTPSTISSRNGAAGCRCRSRSRSSADAARRSIWPACGSRGIPKRRPSTSSESRP